MFVEIGSYDAKTKLPELLRQVQGGRHYRITLRGKPMADLVPTDESHADDRCAAIAAMRAFPRVRALDPATVSDWIREGRR
ncbi:MULTISPECIES: type II toxin-antitoxin system Phd/YefM family antitoxin [Thiorhodovibrio]|uniref:type II toxin-antitoxin system Phd/YefM family antitoxin n=1 Tax=Thiorhodovibrio TaxID=61593 RepID=UPI00191202C3|nr:MULTISPECIES: type II toxin-antitoxin system prevent-host-death family antitoxin [Thiorhodovibrio]MBK5967745.1 prevent-host-death protein [Thiorhodovibrio winogradskyi]WPL14018.1 Antitoxin of toxin-antitoxin stability system [Thiorhodovibrio litoralis]